MLCVTVRVWLIFRKDRRACGEFQVKGRLNNACVLNSPPIPSTVIRDVRWKSESLCILKREEEDVCGVCSSHGER